MSKLKKSPYTYCIKHYRIRRMGATLRVYSLGTPAIFVHFTFGERREIKDNIKYLWKSISLQ